VPRHARVVVDLDAVSHNVGELIARARGAQLCAVVKADGYGHGAVPVARAALGAGAKWLAVALVEEGAQLREAGITEPILLLSEPSLDSFRDAFDLGLTPTIYHRDALAVAARAAQEGGGRSARWAVHLKVDTGMHRVGMPLTDLRDMAAELYASDPIVLGGVFTHLAVADAPQRPETAEQLERFEVALNMLRDAGIDPGITHVANSAAVIAHPATALDLVRCGISIYGIAPSPGLEAMVDLRPAMSVTAEVSHTLTVSAGDAIGYGLTHRFDVDTRLAVLPVGYADGVPRNLGTLGGEVLLGGVRRPVRGVVTMDQMMVELGPVTDATMVPVHRGDEAVLIGSQPVPAGLHTEGDCSPERSGRGFTSVTASDWAAVMNTIPYEIVCGFSARMPREYL
jgi:alanine racemase